MPETAELEQSPHRRRADQAEVAAAALALVTWALLVLPDSGGFHSQYTAVLAVVLFVPIMLSWPWHRAHVGLLVGTSLAALGLLLTALSTEAGWFQTNSAAGHLVGLLALISVRSFARSTARRSLLVGGLIIVTIVQFARAWFPWWGSGDPNHLMVATFYWHNQLAAFFGALALVSAAICVFGKSPLQRPALLVCPLAAAVVVLTTSRSALALLVLGWMVITALALRHPRRLAAAVALPIVTAVTLMLLTGPFFFPNRTWAGPPVLASLTASTSLGEESANTSSAVAGERGTSSVEGNATDRLHWTLAALKSASDAPLLGNGFGSFLEQGEQYLPDHATRSAFVHNGYAEALSSGGILFGGPIVIISLVLGLRALRTLPRSPLADHGVHLAAALSTLFLLGHSLVDFDWQYPGLMILLGICAGLLPAPEGRAVSRSLVVAALAFVVGVAVAGSLLEHEARSEARHAALRAR